jgi:DNA-nicking Smr family endonuclease
MEKIDLHGMRHEFVESALIRKIESMWNTNEYLEIITGNSDEMKRIVKQVLEEYKLDFREGDFYNSGYITALIC